LSSLLQQNISEDTGNLSLNLSPQAEPIILARKPLERGLTVAANVLKWGTGALNIDACRIGISKRTPGGKMNSNADSWLKKHGHGSGYDGPRSPEQSGMNANLGRWPANVCHDGSPEVLAGFPQTSSGQPRDDRGKGGMWAEGNGIPRGPQHGDSGSAARFFYCSKADARDRGYGNSHPTVKPQSLLHWLLRLVAPPNAIILDPFAGSGSTLLAARSLGLRSIGIELDAAYCKIARDRLREEVLPLDFNPKE
jgi:site-specific DNA-methyltransferase (adenine-specific)